MSVVSIRIVVVFPAPLGPRTATVSPRSTCRSMPRTACTVSLRPTTKSFVSPSVWIIPVPFRCPCLDDPHARSGSGQVLTATPRHTRDMATPSGRLLTLLSLLQARRDWTGDQLAQRLGVSPRTVRGDVDRLRELGYPVQTTKGPAGGYRLAPGSDLPPMLFDDEDRKS